MFLGDSRTVAMVNYGYVPEDSTLAQVGLSHVDARQNVYNQTTTGLQYTWDTYLETHKADVIYISYGINGLSYTDEDTYKQSYEDLVDDVIQQCPDSKIVLQSIWPVREGYAATADILNSRVDYYNEFLYAMAEEKGIYYLDTESVLKDDEGAMNTIYNSGDGLHYNESAYEVIFSYLLSHTVPQIEE
jgi:lysophospholipase L1-like esterase